MSRPTTGCPIAVARWSAETSQAVRAGRAPKAAPMGTSVTAMIVELIGLRTAPRMMGGSAGGESAAHGPPISPVQAIWDRPVKFMAALETSFVNR